jgi:uncharacterized sulfatase
VKIMNKFIFLLLYPVSIIALGGCPATGTSEMVADWALEKPNFIIWVADDQYLESVGCYGGDPAQTPNIDKLAGEGLLFTRAYSTASICTPARSALYTGMYPIKNGSHPNHSGLKKDIPSMPSIMRILGYRSAIVGKHGVHDVPTRPTNTFLWDQELPHTRVSIAGTEWSEKAMNKHRVMDWAGIEDFLQPDSLPFCLFVASSLPHGPYLSSTDNGLEGYPANNWKTDWQFGETMRLLGESGNRDNTVVIFVSDNGSNTNRSKYTLFEPGVNVPMIISWPGHISPNTSTDALVDFTDVMPTLMELAGDKASPEMDGKSLVPLMKEKNVEIHEDLYLSHTMLGVNDVYDPYPIRGVVTKQYKFIHYLNHEIDPPRGSGMGKSPEYLLFDLSNDPGESINLAGKADYQKVRAEMQKRLDVWTLEVGDKGMETEYEAVDMFPDKIGHLKKPSL